MSTAEGRGLEVSLVKLQSLYDRHLYLDAFALTANLWNPSTHVDDLTTDELIFAARLAARLGGTRLHRWLLRQAIKRDPDKPPVRYFSRHIHSSKYRLLDELKMFNAQPDLGGDDAELRAAWYGSFAYTWAALRDFDRAYECVALAHALAPNDGWVLSCESNVLGMADRWPDALAAAERAWEEDRGAPFAANVLGNSLLHLGRVQEAADRLYSAAQNSQSYQVVGDACWYQSALAETLEDSQQRQDRLQQAHMLAVKLPALAPLADRETKTLFARTRLDIAELADDHAEIERWSGQLRSPYHRQLLRNLKKNTQGKRVRLPFRRTLQTYQTCVPASVAVALSTIGEVISPEEMAAEITFGGTPEWAAADWLRARGFHVRFFPVTREIAASLIHRQVAFVLAWETDAMGHAVTVVGIDERAETLLVHDPQSFRRTEYLLTVLDQNASPLGLKGMAVVTEDRGPELDALLPPESVLMEAAQQRLKAITLEGPASARQIVDNVAKIFPAHPGTLYLRSIQALDDGHSGQALQGLQELLRQFPNSPLVRVAYMSACRALGNTALIREKLRDIVDRGVLPGQESRQNWIHPPERYIAEYADFLRLSAETRDEAELRLHSLIGRQCSSASAWHNLGDLLWQKRDEEGSLLCYRLASCLETSDEHYARAYADTLADHKREEEGFRWLERRAHRFRTSPHAVATWVSWIATLETRGYPERAIAACREGLMEHGSSPDLLSFAVPFFARMGDWEAAERSLSELRSAKGTPAFYEASVHFFRMRGDPKRASENAAAWISEVPRSMAARHAMLDLITTQGGPRSAVATAAQWIRENPNNEEFEQAYCAQLDNLGDARWKKYSILLRRLKRNREDAWAWREVTFCALYDYELANERRRRRLQLRIPELLAECDRTSRENVGTMRAHALWSEYRGDWSGAIAKSFEAINLDPQGFYSYRHVWDCSARLGDSERTRLWEQIEPVLLNSTDHLSIAGEVVELLAERFGASQAQKTIERWMTVRPSDPNVVQAAADLLIDRGHGRSDALRAVDMLKSAVERYPYHSGLRFSLANAYRDAGQDSQSEIVLSEIVRRHPDNSAAMIQLAWIMHRRGEHETAYKILDQAAQGDIRNTRVLDARVQILIESRRYEDASAAIEEGLRRMPEDVYWRGRAIWLFSQCGNEMKSVQAAREGVEVYPRGAYLWLLLGRTLNQKRQYAKVGEIEFCLRQSLRFNCVLFEAADLLSILLTEQRRYDDAATVMREIENRTPDPSPALGRLAWIKRAQGQQREALDELSQAVTAYPWYTWGWNLLIDWLGEDNAWEKARQLLQVIPPQLLPNTYFRVDRLQLLERAGVQQSQLDAEWDALLHDFPENAPLFLRRYDSLRASNRFEAATSVLNSVLQLQPNNPYIVARRVEVLSQAGDKGSALGAALQVCFLPLEESPWPADKVWDIALVGGFADQLYQEAVRRLATGQKPTIQAFARMIAHRIRLEDKVALQPRTRTWILFGSAKELAKLEQLVRNAGWEGSGYRAELYRELCEYGYHRVVRRLWKKNRTIPMQTSEWSQVGRALLGANLHDECRQFLSTWRDRPGVGMWVVTNYTVCLSRLRRSQLEELRATCQEALSGIPHDHCANYLAHVLAEACALLGDKDGFLQTWNTYSAYFSAGLKKGEYFQPRRRHLLSDVPTMARYLQQNETRLYGKMLWRLRWNSFRPSRIFTRSENPWFARIPWWVWWILLMLALQLFKDQR